MKLLKLNSGKDFRRTLFKNWNETYIILVEKIEHGRLIYSYELRFLDYKPALNSVNFTGIEIEQLKA